ncbi:M50 family peptidase [Staphylococcus haemolyticus]|uniref:M50 family metallopeptidase n=1 Tax=Staphylococcus TaxID=1279 RepID=UPI000D1D71AD|nr:MULTISPECIES: M50 family metallopeptidase [Staphylococcus]MCE4962737.1 M50 family metallopeptidase [Staphylococcus haemolyticus]MCE4987829.1 M50 family metallopeptidase [Staphylococcus haemolyticus]MCE4991289.1 M50 family metallopeptidase [Staphylococcus haemolyticus]MCE5035611.1 M50 family metallopeptidase [Staphylococcus haemolyticus]MCE5049967.1 M50 family metallopeptidase [Staphylococcus haemolyticus]
MVYLENFFTTIITLNIYLIIIIAIIYIMIHQNRHRQINQYLDVYLNYIPVLTHEFGHVLFNKLSGGRAKDLVIVTRPSERLQTMQQGYAITQSKGLIGQFITTLGGYVMPPIMLLIGISVAHYGHPSLFLVSYIFIFIYYLVLTSRKLSPIVVLIILIALLYFLVQHDNQMMFYYLVVLLYHLILGVLLGEVLQSSWTIFKLTFQRPRPSWDGSTLSEITHIPTIIYSTIWIAINLFAIYLMFQFIL